MSIMLQQTPDIDVGSDDENGRMQIVVGPSGRGRVILRQLGDPGAARELAETELPDAVAELEGDHPRWVWSDTRRWYPALLAAGVRVERCHDLRLAAAILDGSSLTAGPRGDPRHRPSEAWLREAASFAPTAHGGSLAPGGVEALFELDDSGGSVAPGLTSEREPEHRVREGRGAGTAAGPAGDPASAIEVLEAELARQLALVRASTSPQRLRLLLAAESVGALIGVEMQVAGLPWRREVHERVLEELLGPRPSPGRKPREMERLAAAVREALGDPGVNLDSQTELLRSLQRAGIAVTSTRRWELREHEHPAIEPLVAYKRLARLYSANAWAWLDEWIEGGRFRPEYVPGGTATGRWATNGGGALQLPKNVRAAVVADPGWALVVADAAQLEPRMLAGLARDEAMAAAGRGRDLYSGLVDRGVVETRDQAKVAILGAMYGATTGDSGRLVPRLAKAYPRAMALVDDAAREGERGGVVSTLLGRSSPPPSERWRAVQAAASEPGATAAEERRARSSARDWGRFTRNFVVQGSAAEWALCWMGELRKRLAALEWPDDGRSDEARRPAEASGPAFARRPHLVFYLHDEIIVHTPTELAPAAALAVSAAAREAGRLLFGDFPVDFPLDLAVVESYDLAGA